jgi:ribosomal protein L35AE/L33A
MIMTDVATRTNFMAPVTNETTTISFSEVNSGTCEDHDYITIEDVDECREAAMALGKTIAWGPYGGYKDVIDGCSARFSDSSSHIFFNKRGTCDPNDAVGHWTYTGCKCSDWMPCFCKKKTS